MAFTNEQLERYSRHIILKEVGAKGQKKLPRSVSHRFRLFLLCGHPHLFP